uniref:Uncharacterized protein n=1 Tax=Timema bartmani TaxID=61472 RepID=A0A7R9F0V1_9NEOP|nr:unnamed protein product [Timema bartmani]
MVERKVELLEESSNISYSSPMASLVLTDSSQLTADGFEKLPDQIMYPYAEPYDLQKNMCLAVVISDSQNLGIYLNVDCQKSGVNCQYCTKEAMGLLYLQTARVGSEPTSSTPTLKQNENLSSNVNTEQPARETVIKNIYSPQPSIPTERTQSVDENSATRVGSRMAAYLLLAILWRSSAAQCPWQREVKELQSSCICAYNLGQELSVQCDMVDFPVLLSALDKYAASTPLDLLYVNNSTIVDISDGAFKNILVRNVQLSGCRIRTVAPGAFVGQEGSLKNLNLQDNEISEVPVESLRLLSNLSLLDLSRNKILRVPDEAFVTLKNLSTLKLSDNNLTLSSGAFRGLEGSLKNLNLKGTRQKRMPEAVRGLKTLAFLDLAQNGLRELPGSRSDTLMEGLDSLTALNLERNLIQMVGDMAFFGVNDTLSSLSLLNNLLTEFPTVAINSLTELRVLDIGFNLLTDLPENSFLGTPSLTLLALDGNPLITVPEKAMAHLNTSLRGLSLGGRFLQCDCKLRWVTLWIRQGDLQVTSRERNPQFCGSPAMLRDRGFYSILPEDSSVIIQWDSETANILGFRVVYRLFGDKSFKQGPPLEASEREFKIKNVPTQECIIVCVVSLEEVNVTPETVPYSQCREVRTVTSPTSNMDKITIAASAAICGTVVIAVVVFVAASRRSQFDRSEQTRKLHTLRQTEAKSGIPIGGMPVNCCTGMGHTPSPGGPLSSLATLSAFTNHKDWDQVSMYSNRSIPRPRVFHMERTGSVSAFAWKGEWKTILEKITLSTQDRDSNLDLPVIGSLVHCESSALDHAATKAGSLTAGCLADDMRSHPTHFSSKGVKSRSIADGQSQHSFSNHSGRYLTGSAFAGGLATSRPDLRQSRQSLAAASEHLSRVSYPAGGHAHHQPTSRRRSRSRDHQSPGSRYSTAGSTHTLNNYCDTSDNWTDHDMDIYMARNPTTRGGLVPL